MRRMDSPPQGRKDSKLTMRVRARQDLKKNPLIACQICDKPPVEHTPEEVRVCREAGREKSLWEDAQT